MEQPKRNAIGQNLRRIRIKRELSQQRLSVECSRLGYEIPRATLAKIEAEIRAVSDIEIFVLAHALKIEIGTLYPPVMIKMIRDGKIAPFHVRERDETDG